MESSGIFEEVPCHKPVRKSLLKVPIFKKFDNARYQFYFSVNSNQSDTSLRWIHTHLFPMFCMKLRIRLKNLKGVFVSVWLNIETSDRLLAFFRSTHVVTWPAATRFFLPTTNGGRGERAWEQGCRFLDVNIQHKHKSNHPKKTSNMPTTKYFFLQKNNSKIECITRTNR